MPAPNRLEEFTEDEIERLEGWLFGAGGLSGAEAALLRRVLARGPERRRARR